MQFGYPNLIRLSFFEVQSDTVRFWIAESGWIAIRKPDHVQHWCSSLLEVAGVTFSDSDSAPVPKFWIRIRKFFKFENPAPVQTSAIVIDPTVIYQCFYLRNDHTDSCYCRNWEVTPDPGPVFPKFLTPGPDPGPKEKRRILPESTPVIRIRSHLWSLSSTPEVIGVTFLTPAPVPKNVTPAPALELIGNFHSDICLHSESLKADSILPNEVN